MTDAGGGGASDASAGSADGGRVDASDPNDAEVSDDAGPGLVPCGSVTTSGRCASPTRVELCAVQTGGRIPPHLESYDCPAGQLCDDTQGAARCVANTECSGDETSCGDPSTLRSCVAGSWVDSACATRCVGSALGAACAPNVSTQRVSGKVVYEARNVNGDLTDWSATAVKLPARRFFVLSLRGDTLIDSTTTDEMGAFNVLAPTPAGPNDKLVVLCAGQDAAGRLAFAVADAGYAPSANALREPFEGAPDPRIWSFSLALTSFNDKDVITLPESAGSGAARVFETLHGIFNDMQTHYAPTTTQTVIVWVSPGTSWTCGACMTSTPVALAGQTFLHQLWLDGSDEDQGYWSDAVSAHELGHYVMAGFGYPPAEGGPHYTGYPTNPGQAWSEGWATFFSGLHRDTGLYYDKQGSTFFWFDLDARTYSLDDLPWQRPQAAEGLTQLIDENEVAAMLRKASLTIGSGGPMLDALQAERARVPPFEGGYTLRVWSDPDHPEDFETTRTSIPHLPDFFDALLCADAISAADLNVVTNPSVHYPYASASPICR